MAVTVSNITIPPAVGAPRGAAWAAAFAAMLAAVGRSAGAVAGRLGPGLWRVLEAQGQRRASRDLLEMAERRQSDAPGLAQDLRVAAAYLRSPPRR